MGSKNCDTHEYLFNFFFLLCFSNLKPLSYLLRAVFSKLRASLSVHFLTFPLDCWLPRFKVALGYSTVNRKKLVNLVTLGFQFPLLYKSLVAYTFSLLIKKKNGLNLSLKISAFSLNYVLLLYT